MEDPPPGWLADPPSCDGWLGRSASVLTKRPCFGFVDWPKTQNLVTSIWQFSVGLSYNVPIKLTAVSGYPNPNQLHCNRFWVGTRRRLAKWPTIYFLFHKKHSLGFTYWWSFNLCMSTQSTDLGSSSFSTKLRNQNQSSLLPEFAFPNSGETGIVREQGTMRFGNALPKPNIEWECFKNLLRDLGTSMKFRKVPKSHGWTVIRFRNHQLSLTSDTGARIWESGDLGTQCSRNPLWDLRFSKQLLKSHTRKGDVV